MGDQYNEESSARRHAPSYTYSQAHSHAHSAAHSHAHGHAHTPERARELKLKRRHGNSTRRRERGLLGRRVNAALAASGALSIALLLSLAPSAVAVEAAGGAADAAGGAVGESTTGSSSSLTDSQAMTDGQALPDGQLLPDGTVVVDVYAESREALPQVRAALASLIDISTVSTTYAVVSGRSPADAVESIRSLPGVRSVVTPLPPVAGNAWAQLASSTALATPRPALVPRTTQLPATCRAIPVEADDPLQTAIARATYGVDGTGITIGVISDSFGTAAAAGLTATTPSQDVAMGSLPGPGNPCGYFQPVTVVRDAPAPPPGFPTTVQDEGRAMAQLVHGIAPGATLLVANGGDSMFDMAQAIDLLRQHGADIIVDDLSYYFSPFYQQGPIDSAIARATAQGISYYTSAGNASLQALDGTQIGSWTSSAFALTDCPAWVPAAVTTNGCLDFSTTGAPDSTNALVVADAAEGFTAGVMVQWGEPWSGVTTPLVAMAYSAETGVLGVAGCTHVLGICDQSLTLLTVDLDPGIVAGDLAIEFAIARAVPSSAPNPTDPAWTAAHGTPAVRMQFLKPSGPVRSLEHATSAIVGAGGAGPAPERTVTVGGTLIANNAGPNAFAVGAAPYNDPGELRGFSSFGPSTHLFAPLESAPLATPAAPLATPYERAGADAVSVDSTRTSFFSPAEGAPPGGPYRFTGTSAAAPHAAAIAALVRDAHGNTLSIAEEQAAMRAGVIPVGITALGSLGALISPSSATGSGLILATSALAASGAQPQPAPGPQPAPVPSDGTAPGGGHGTGWSGPGSTAGPLPRTGADATTQPALLTIAVALVAAGVGLAVVSTIATAPWRRDPTRAANR